MTLASGINGHASRVGGHRMSAAAPSAHPSRPPVTYVTPDRAELVVSLQDHGERTWPTIDYSTPLGDGNVRVVVAQLDPDQDFCKCRDCVAANPEHGVTLRPGNERTPIAAQLADCSRIADEILAALDARDPGPSTAQSPIAKLLTIFAAVAEVGGTYDACTDSDRQPFALIAARQWRGEADDVMTGATYRIHMYRVSAGGRISIYERIEGAIT